MWLDCTAVLQQSGRSVMLEGDLLRYCKLPQPRLVAAGSRGAQQLVWELSTKPKPNSSLP